MKLGWISIIVFLFLLALLPIVFAKVLVTALVKLRLAPEVAVLVVVGIILGSVINIPITRIVRHEDVVVHPLALFGLGHLWPQWQRIQRETIIAVNVGGCVIPSMLALYEIGQLLAKGGTYLVIVGGVVLLNTGVCYIIAKPVEGVGIAMPAFLPPVVAALSALLFAPEEAPAVAFVAGVMGPLLGADLLHLRDLSKVVTGMASIGGAGTFDGIVLSGILAAYLA